MFGMMSGFHLFGCFGIVIALVLVVIPLAKILGRVGHSQLLAILALIPVANIILLWYIAYSRWPRAEQNP